MASAKDLLDKARSQLGVAENPPGSNQVLYASWAGIPGLAWCGAFVSWCFAEVGMAAEVPTFVWTPSGAQFFRSRGQYGGEPRIGAVVFFRWPEVGRISHVGLVEAVRDDGSIVTIEGNTDERGGSTGGKVMRHVRRAFIDGYGYPSYSELAPNVPNPPVHRPMIRQGSRGPNVTYLQQKLGGLVVDGIFGPKTDGAVRRFQQANRLVVDGIVGPRTWAAIG